MGIRWSTDNKGVVVYRFEDNGKPTYKIRHSKKEGDTWLSEYQRVRFRGSPDIPNKTTVYVKDGFEVPDTWVKNGTQHKDGVIKVAMDYSYAGMKEAPKQSFMDMPDYPDSFSAAEEDLPF